MATKILVTKLFIPKTRPELVLRPELVKRLNNGLDRKLTLISAPAGFGKTTLVTEWVENLWLNTKSETQVENKIAWLSLDEGDNDPIRFLTYLIAALNQIDGLDKTFVEGTLSLLRSPQPPPIETILTSLINEVASISDRIILVLDDFHLISDQAIHDALTFLIEHQPLQMHLIIATREDPPLPLAGLRGKDQMTELRAKDLRFTSSETADFLNRVMGLGLSQENITTLETRTEGWIAGLQLAAISMQGHTDVTSFIKSFTGSHRLVLDFLIEEVLGQQPENIQNFLLHTAILNRLTGSLCEALTGQENSQETLEVLDRANLFLVQLDNERRWYRYHHLFADLLKQRLIAHNSGEVFELHTKAAKWYETNGELSEAVHHALAGKDIKTATRLIEKGALTALENSDFRFILDSVGLLPESVLPSSPWLFIYHTWALFLTGQVEAASSKLENIEGLFDLIAENDEIQQREMLGNIAALKMFSAAYKRDNENLPKYADQVKEYLPENNWIRAYCAIFMGAFFWGNGNLDGAINAFAEAASVGKTSGHKLVAVSGACNHAHSLELAGHLLLSFKLYQDTFKIAKQNGRVLPMANYIHIQVARVHYELNELDLAEKHLRDGIKLSKQNGDRRAEKIAYCHLVKVQAAKGDIANAYLSYQNAEKSVPPKEVDFDLRGGEYPQVWLWLKQKKVLELEGWLNQNSITCEEVPHFKTKFTLGTHARVLIALYREHQDEIYVRKVLELLECLIEIAETNGWGSKVIEFLALQSVTLQEYGKIEQAQTKLERAIKLAVSEGYIRTFVDEGQPMKELLLETRNRGIEPDYVRRLLAAFPDADLKGEVLSKPHVDQSGSIEPLSDREIEVLQLLAKGLTNQVIAVRLIISPHTVKTHIRNIYGKLRVNNRTQAIDKARALGFISPD